MSKIPEEVIAEWAKKKKHIQDRLNRIKKRLKKYQKQEKHFELRMRLVKEHESKARRDAEKGKGKDSLPESKVSIPV